MLVNVNQRNVDLVKFQVTGCQLAKAEPIVQCTINASVPGKLSNQPTSQRCFLIDISQFDRLPRNSLHPLGHFAQLVIGGSHTKSPQMAHGVDPRCAAESCRDSWPTECNLTPLTISPPAVQSEATRCEQTL